MLSSANPARASDPPIALLGGTFDPVHYGHLRFAEDVRVALGLAEVRLVPSANPPHRTPPVANADDRAAMVGLAVREFPGLRVDTRELRRDGPSYTVDTLEELRAAHPRSPLIVVLGADAFGGLAQWHRWQDLFALAHVVVAPRPGVAPGAALPAGLAQEWKARLGSDPSALRSRLAGTIYVQPITAYPISATSIRDTLQRTPLDERALAQLLPPAVLAYIESRQLYRFPTNAT